jgi:hypothetical protein
MLPLFCLRLATGSLFPLLLLRPSRLNPRFYRTQFLTALGLGSISLLLLLDSPAELLIALGLGLFLAALGSMSWSVEGNPGGKTLIVLALAALAAAQGLAADSDSRPLAERVEARAAVWVAADEVSSSALLGLALTTMLLGHNYLIAPSMSLTPLKTLLVALSVALLARAAVAGTAFALWTGGRPRLSLTEEAVLWLPVRWLLGLVVPAILTGMAWQTARLRNTQSSTGILYIVVVFVFLGELTTRLLRDATGHFL